MFEKLLSISSGTAVGLADSLTNNNWMHVVIMSFVGGLIGWFGGQTAHWILIKIKKAIGKSKDNSDN